MSVYAGQQPAALFHDRLRFVMPSWEYAPAPESRDIVNLRSEYGLFIDGAFVEPSDGGTFKTVNPASEEVLAAVSAAGTGDIDRAVAAARRAQTEVWGRCRVRSAPSTCTGWRA